MTDYQELFNKNGTTGPVKYEGVNASEWLIDPNKLPKTKNVIGFIETQLSKEELLITSLKTNDLIAKLQKGELKATTVLLAFLHRAAIAQQLAQPVAEFYDIEALSKAAELDRYYEKHGEPIGSLHGLPISIKEEFDVKGHATTLGALTRANADPALLTSPPIQSLVDHGAIVFLKSNVPTAVFNNVTVSQLYGATLNPHNTNFTSGGSTGGEAALIALRASPLGVGTDLGGSIRQPASFNGIYGMKPSSARVPHLNTASVVSGLESLRGTNGPMSNDIDALGTYFEKVLSTEPWLKDTNVVKLEWDEKSAKEKINSKEKLKFAVLFDDGHIRPTPGVRRALNVIVEKVKEAGHEVFEWDNELNTDVSQIAKFADIFMESNGIKSFLELMNKSGESSNNTNDLNVSKLWELQSERASKVNEFWKLWNEVGIDGFISPVSALSGCTFDGFYDYTYSPLANVLDFPSVAFPVLKVDKDIDIVDQYPSYREPEEQKVWENYSPEESHGVPIGLQIIGPKLQEEYTLELAKILVELVDYKSD